MITHVRALLFDMDGTLVESTDCVESVWKAWCDANSVCYEEVVKICHGVRSVDVVRRIAPYLNLDEQVMLLEDLEIEHTKAVNTLPGAEAFLSSVNPYSWGVVTSAPRRVARHRFICSGLKLPDVMVAAGDVCNGKPDPEPYLMAAYLLGQKPEDCLVFEDAKAGILSALCAGCQVIQVGGERALDHRVNAVVKDWHELSLSSANEVEISIQTRAGSE